MEICQNFLQKGDICELIFLKILTYLEKHHSQWQLLKAKCENQALFGHAGHWSSEVKTSPGSREAPFKKKKKIW